MGEVEIMANPHGAFEDQAALREQLAAAYAAGALEPAMRLLVEAQSQVAARAARDYALAETVAGALLEQETPQALAAGAFEKVWARAAAAPQERPKPALPTAALRAGALLDEILGLPDALRRPALEQIGAGGWSFAGPGMRSLALPLPGEPKAELLRIEPGWGAPRHAHRGGEFTLVVRGAFADERGRYGRGDISIAGPGVTHRPIAEAGEICYALAVSEAPIEFTGALGLVQRFLQH